MCQGRSWCAPIPTLDPLGHVQVRSVGVDPGFLLGAQTASLQIFKGIRPKEIDLHRAVGFLVNVESNRGATRHASAHFLHQGSPPKVASVMAEVVILADQGSLLFPRIPVASILCLNRMGRYAKHVCDHFGVT